MSEVKSWDIVFKSQVKSRVIAYESKVETGTRQNLRAKPGCGQAIV